MVLHIVHDHVHRHQSYKRVTRCCSCEMKQVRRESSRHKGRRFFSVKSAHAGTCKCDKVHLHSCRLQAKDVAKYDKAAHWSWQTNSEYTIWKPEIYETFTRSISVTRYVAVDDIEACKGRHDHICRFLHFDFILGTRLRELDRGWNGFKRIFKSAYKPPELRRHDDSGYPLTNDQVRFCVRPCYEKIKWPKKQTRHYEKEARKKASPGSIRSYVTCSA